MGSRDELEPRGGHDSEAGIMMTFALPVSRDPASLFTLSHSVQRSCENKSVQTLKTTSKLSQKTPCEVPSPPAAWPGGAIVMLLPSGLLVSAPGSASVTLERSPWHCQCDDPESES
eukprot:1998423-Rhodomonas_salina.1